MASSSSRICVIFSIIAAYCVVSVHGHAGSLSWGTFLGADWRTGEENMRNDLAVYIKNTQRICTKDVEKLCLGGRYVSAHSSAYADWTTTSDDNDITAAAAAYKNNKRHMHKNWEDVPLGFGNAPDKCLRDEVDRYNNNSSSSSSSPSMRRRLIPKCLEWMERAEGQYEKLSKRERGNDRREAFVVFSSLFATAVASAMGYMFGIFLKEREDYDLFSYHNRGENKKMLIFFCVAMSLPVLVILWACPRLLLIMAAAFGVGRGAQYYVQRRQEGGEYLSLPMRGSNSGLVFAAIPVMMN